VLADERGQHLHHGRVVSRGVAGDALQRVDTADPYIKLLGAELLDGLGVAVGHLSLLGQLVAAPLPLVGLFGVTPQQAEVQGGEDQRD
jgi:hypothetical protein